MTVGKIICKKHGEQPISFVSPNISAYIRNSAVSEAPPQLKIVKLTVFDVDGFFPMDEQFIIENSINNESLLNEEQAEAIFEKLQPICGECLKEVLSRRKT